MNIIFKLKFCRTYNVFLRNSVYHRLVSNPIFEIFGNTYKKQKTNSTLELTVAFNISSTRGEYNIRIYSHTADLI